MSDDLFPSSAIQSDSPRLKWMKRHQISVITKDGKHIAYIDEDLWGAGDTEEEALLDLIEVTDLPHWNKPYFQ